MRIALSSRRSGLLFTTGTEARDRLHDRLQGQALTRIDRPDRPAPNRIDLADPH
ncbi:hypothetical protein [Streptomyces sp. 8N616]|uniref:hypothetical protein n=1 Tax=Streptomyces sp. 8N616 TaxID=3457414 RepID=UPI003FD5ADCA